MKIWLDAARMCMLGDQCYFGHGTSRNIQEAMTYYLKSAEDGNAAAMVRIGSIYQDPASGMLDEHKAMLWYVHCKMYDKKHEWNNIRYLKASKLDDAQAIYKVGALEVRGLKKS